MTAILFLVGIVIGYMLGRSFNDGYPGGFA